MFVSRTRGEKQNLQCPMQILATDLGLWASNEWRRRCRRGVRVRLSNVIRLYEFIRKNFIVWEEMINAPKPEDIVSSNWRIEVECSAKM